MSGGLDKAGRAMGTRAAERAPVPAGAACPDEARDGDHAA
jgi:hypothetical protein